jgi:hypothetical protein
MLERCPLGLPRGEMYPCIVSEEFVSKKLYQKKKFRAVITCRPSLYYTYEKKKKKKKKKMLSLDNSSTLR